jgi:hypothetical protein
MVASSKALTIRMTADDARMQLVFKIGVNLLNITIQEIQPKGGETNEEP